MAEELEHRLADDDAALTLDDVIGLLEGEIERLKTALQTYRLLDHPRKAEIIRWHVRNLDARQDRLDELRAMLLARRDVH
ncbi:MAG: hypothetical protein H6993_03015 [Pseudomonadales bacterium]|nr:hypothetical protein [Planctomycetales bacterium]MCP5180729.1 hypothetical protein [Pseudomonadales bacterium]MCP5182902.1 hypothetical protein [Pseudomonadales bacterium]